MPNGKPRRLKRLKLAEISVVGNPAQQHARITVTKGLDKAAAQTSEAQGHRHEILITGNGSMGLNLILTEYTGDSGESHTHPVVRTRGGWQIGMAAGHTHTLPDVSRIIARLLETDPASEPEPEPVGKQDTSGHAVVAHTSETQAHQHTIIRRQNGTYALGLGGDPSHTHEITLDGDRVQVAMAEGHTHDVKEPMSTLVNKSADKQAEIHALLELDNLKNWRKKKEDSIMNDIEKSRLAKAQAENDLEGLAKRCADELKLTPEQGMDRVLQTAKGQELYNAMVTPMPVAKGVDPLGDYVAGEVNKRLAKSTSEWDSAETVAEKRRQLDREVMDSPEYADKYRKAYAPPPPAPRNPDPLGLRKSGESWQRCADRLVVERALAKGITSGQAYAELLGEEVALPILEEAYGETVRASEAASLAMTLPGGTA